MIRNNLKIVSIIITGSLATGIINFLIFIYFYKAMIAEHLTEYWKTVHGGMMFDEILPIFLIAAFISVIALVFMTRQFGGCSENKKSLNERKK